MKRISAIILICLAIMSFAACSFPVPQNLKDLFIKESTNSVIRPEVVGTDANIINGETISDEEDEIGGETAEDDMKEEDDRGAEDEHEAGDEKEKKEIQQDD